MKKEKQKKLLIEMMQEDEKNGMYEESKSESPLIGEISEYDKALEEYLDTGIVYSANSLKNADVGDLQQLASDSFFYGYQLKSKPVIGERSAEEMTLQQAKELVAKKHRFQSWHKLMAGDHDVLSRNDEAAELYASQFKAREDSLEETDAKFTEASKKLIENAPTKTYKIVKGKEEVNPYDLSHIKRMRDKKR